MSILSFTYGQEFPDYMIENCVQQILDNLHLCTFKTLSSGAVMSERCDADCAFTT